MKNVVKDLLKSTVISIGMALTIFCLIGVAFRRRPGIRNPDGRI